MSEGYCEVDFDDYSGDADPVEFATSKIVKARKVHRCEECRGEIAVGDSYQRTSYKFEGSMDVAKRCKPCLEAATEFHFAVLGGGLWEMFAEEWSQGANLQGCMNRLTTAKAKEHMRQQWMKWKKIPAPPPATEPK